MLLLVLPQPGCSTIRRVTKRKEVGPDAQTLAMSRRPLQRVGVITLFDEAGGFALIDSGSNPTPAAGARLLSYTGPTPSAQLKVGDVRRRPFVVADLEEGAPRKGDEVFEAGTGVAVPVKVR